MVAPHRTEKADARPAGDGKPRGDEAPLTSERLERLLDLSRALAGACEHAQIAVIAAEQARILSGASVTQVSGLRDGGALAVIAEGTGAAPVGRRLNAPASIRATGPEHDVARTREPIWIRSRVEASETRPGMALDALTGGPDATSWAFLPLAADGDASGVLTLVFDRAQAFDDATRTFLAEVADACGNALARGSLFTEARARARASDKARAVSETRRRRSEGQASDREHLYEKERFARARAEAETMAARADATAARDRKAGGARAPRAFVAQYDEAGAERPVTRVLGVFSSEASAREALRKLGGLALHAAITSWTLDVASSGESIGIDPEP